MTRGRSVSACIIARDEEKELPGCLDSIRAVVDETIVVDTGSRDRTPDLARKGGARVFDHPWNDDFSAARNAALERASCDWILVIDADERLEAIGRKAFREPLADHGKLGFLLTLKNLSAEGASEVRLLRLFRNRDDLRFSGIIHERVDPALMRITSNAAAAVGAHPGRLIHRGYLETVREEKDKDRRDLRLLRKQIAGDQDDPFFWYKFAAHPFVRSQLKDEMRAAVHRAWALVREQDRDAKRYSYTPEVAALFLLEAFAARDYEAASRAVHEVDRFTLSSPNLDYTLGVSFLLALDLHRSVHHFERALAAGDAALPYAPFSGVTGHLSLHGLSEARYLQQEEELSHELFERAIASGDGSQANSFHGDPSTLVQNGEAVWAIDLLTRAVQARPADHRLWHRGGLLLKALGMTDRAAQWLDRAGACARC